LDRERFARELQLGVNPADLDLGGE